MEYVERIQILINFKHNEKLIATFKEFVHESINVNEVNMIMLDELNNLKNKGEYFVRNLNL